MGESVDVRPLVRDHLDGLWAVHAQIRERLAARTASWENVLLAARAKYEQSCPGPRTTVGLAAVMTTDDGEHETTLHMVTEFNDYRRYLEAKNQGVDGLTRRYVTNEAEIAPLKKPEHSA
jgi:hypothetical protein